MSVSAFVCGWPGLQRAVPARQFSEQFKMRTLVLALALCVSIAYSAECPHPGVPRNGFAYKNSSTGERVEWPTLEADPLSGQRNLKPGETIHFGCNDKWRLSSTGNERIECMDDGSLSGSLPTCLRVLDNLNWKGEFSISGNVQVEVSTYETFPCDDSRYSAILARPSVDLRVSDIMEVRLEECPDSEFNGIVRVRVNNGHNCTLTAERERVKTFSCGGLDRSLSNPVDFITVSSQTPMPIFTVMVLTRSGSADLCGFPPVPPNVAVEFISAGRFFYFCDHPPVRGNVVSCDPLTGEWDHIPTCPAVSEDWDTPNWIIILAVAAAVVIVAGIALFVGRRKRRESAGSKTITWSTVTGQRESLPL